MQLISNVNLFFVVYMKVRVQQQQELVEIQCSSPDLDVDLVSRVTASISGA